MRDNSYQNSTFTSVMKLIVAGVVVLILLLAAFGTGVGIGVGQGRAMARADAPVAVAPVEQAELAAEAAPAAAPTPAQEAAAPAATQARATAGASAIPGASATPVASATPAITPSPTVPEPTPTRQDKSRLPDEAPIDMALVNEAWKLLKEQYYGNLPEGEDVTYAAIRGILATLGDKHTAFLDPEQAAVSNEMMDGSFEGIGALVDTPDGGGVQLQHIYADSPAEKAGLQNGDVVIRVDGKDITTLELNDAVALIRGPKDTKVTLTVKRADQPVFDVVVTRARVELPIVETETLSDGKIEYIRLGEFSVPAAERMILILLYRI